MTKTWPGKPGVPINADRDGWHWVRSSEGIVPALWARPFWRHCRDFWDQRSPEWMEDRGWRYLGPVLTPDETAALQKRCEEAERERDALRRDTSQEIATDKLVRRLQHLGDWQAADRIEALQARADRNAAGFARVDAEAERAKFLHKQEIAALQKRVAELVEALGTLEKAASYTAKLGAVTGAHWLGLGTALIKARAALTGEER